MRGKWLWATALWGTLLAPWGLAQEKSQGASVRFSEPVVSWGQMTPTPSMWYYEQEMKHYMDPKMMARRKAEYQARQRYLRLASRRWFGFSLLRPRWSTMPWSQPLAPHWVATYHDPYAWPGSGRVWIPSRPVPWEK